MHVLVQPKLFAVVTDLKVVPPVEFILTMLVPPLPETLMSEIPLGSNASTETFTCCVELTGPVSVPFSTLGGVSSTFKVTDSVLFTLLALSVAVIVIPHGPSVVHPNEEALVLAV